MNHQPAGRDDDDDVSLVETGLVLLGFSQENSKQLDKHASSLLTIHHGPLDDDSDAICLHDLSTIDNGNARTRGDINKKSALLMSNGSCFVASDASTFVNPDDNTPHSLYSNSTFHDAHEDHCDEHAISDAKCNVSFSRSVYTTPNKTAGVSQSHRNINGHSNLNPLRVAADGLPQPKTKRRLQWRVGPLIKKNRARPRHKSKSKNGRKYNDEASLAERTVKSFHTAHSSETVQAGNFQPNTFLQGGQGHASTPPKSKNVSMSSKGNTNVSSPNTVATVLSNEDDEDNFSDSGTIVAAYDGEEEWENSHFVPQRTIGLFLYDSERGREGGQTGNRTPGSTIDPNSPQGKIRNGHAQVGGGKGLPPLAPSGKGKNSSSAAITLLESAPPAYLNDNEENAGGPLWELAKLQAISEGISSPPSTFSTSMENHSSPETSPKSDVSSKSDKKPKRRFFPFSNKNDQKSTGNSDNQSVGSNYTSSSSQSELQRNQAERNLRAMQRLASQHLSYGEFREAIDVLEEILRGVQEMCGERHYRVGTVLHNISTVRMRCQDYKEAVNVSRKAVEVRRMALGSDHSDVAISYAQLGMAHMELGEYDYAVMALRNALAIRKKRLSFRDRKIARLCNNIGCCLFELKRMREALKAFEEALKIQRINLKFSGSSSERGAGNSDENSHDVGANNVSQGLLGVASTLCNLASIHLKLNCRKEALVYLDEALLIQQSVLGDAHPTVINTKDTIEFLNENGSNSPITVDTPSLQELIAGKMKQIGFRSSTDNGKKSNASMDNSKMGKGLPFFVPSPMGLFSDVMSLNGTDWIQVLEDIGGVPVTCKGCTHDWEDATMSSNAGDSGSFGKDLHWI